MAITPMALPSPKAYDPNSMEVTNLALFKDPYTVDRASVQADLFRSDREAAGEQYQHAVAGQQDYYNRALEYQNQAGLREDLPKILNAEHGVQFLPGLLEYRDMLNRMGPGAFNQVATQSYQNRVAGTAKTTGEAALLGYQSGNVMSPQTQESVTGLPSTAMDPGKLREIALENQGKLAAAQAHGGKEKTVKFYPPSTYGMQMGAVDVPISIAEKGEAAVHAYMATVLGIPPPASAKNDMPTPRVNSNAAPPPTPRSKQQPTAAVTPPSTGLQTNPYNNAPAAKPATTSSSNRPAPAVVVAPPPRQVPAATGAEWKKGIVDLVEQARQRLGI